MTPEEWKQAESRLQYLHGQAKFVIDGYEVDVCLKQVSTYKNALMVYINGFFKGEWLVNDCEERRRFFAHKQKPVISNHEWEKMRRELKLTAREFKQFKAEHDEKVNYYYSHWTSFAAMKKHFIANNKDIHLVG